MPVTFPTEFLFKRLSDFWNFFEDKEDVKNIWDAYLRKSKALNSLLTQANLSKSLASIPIFDRNDLEYFIFDKLTRREDLEANSPFYVFEIDPTIVFIKDLNEKIDNTDTNRKFTPPNFFTVSAGTGGDDGKAFLNMARGVNAKVIGETTWTRSSDLVTGSGFNDLLTEGDILQGQNQKFYKVAAINSDTEVQIQGRTVVGESLGAGDGTTTIFNLSTDDLFTSIPDELVVTGPISPGTQSTNFFPYEEATLQLRKGADFATGEDLALDTHYTIDDPNAGTFTITSSGATFIGTDQLRANYRFANPFIATTSVKIYFDGSELTSGFTVTSAGVVSFTTAPAATVAEITADYHFGYDGPSVINRRTVRESIPSRLVSFGVYRDRRSIFTNFGTAIGLDKATSFQYLNEVRGIYFARYKGPSTANLDLGSGILIGVPFAERGTVNAVNEVEPKSAVVDGRLINIPSSLTPTVTAGQELDRDFNLISDGVRTVDFINDPDIFNLEPLKSDPGKFFKFLVLVSGSYAIQVAQETGQPIDYSLLKRFKSDIKPSYTDCFVVTNIDFLDEAVNLFIGAVDVTNAIDAASTMEFNCLNFSVIPEFMENNGFPFTVADETVATGPVTAGLFATEFQQIKEGTLEVHAGTIAGPQLTLDTDYTEDLILGQFTLTASGAAIVNGEAPPDIHVKYTSGLAGEADLVASGLCDMDSDTLHIDDDINLIVDCVTIETLENNLVNFGVSPPGTEDMDLNTLELSENMDIKESVSGSPGSTIYSF